MMDREFQAPSAVQMREGADGQYRHDDAADRMSFVPPSSSPKAAPRSSNMPAACLPARVIWQRLTAPHAATISPQAKTHVPIAGHSKDVDVDDDDDFDKDDDDDDAALPEPTNPFEHPKQVVSPAPVQAAAAKPLSLLRSPMRPA